MHVTQDIICEEEKSGQPDGSPASSRPPWPEEGGLKENSLPEEGPVKDLVKRKIRYICSELLNIAVASIIENRSARPEGPTSLVSRPSSVCTMRPEEHVVRLEGSGQPGGAPSRGPGKRGLSDLGSSSSLMGLKNKNSPAKPSVPDGMEAYVPARKNQPRYACLELIDVALRDTRVASWRENQVPSLAGVESHMTKEMSVLAGASTLPTPGNLEAKETSATSSAEQYFVHAPIALETRQVQSMKACMRRMLDCYLKQTLQTVNNPVKMKHKKQCLLSKEPVKTKDVNKKDDQCQAMEKPAKAKTVTWMLRGATKVMSTITAKTAKVVPRVTPTRSRWRIWDPGRNEAVVLRGVIVRNKHVRGAVSQSYTERIWVWRCPGRSSVSYPSLLGSRLNLVYICVYSTL
jgi:hypothetical protein